MASSSNSKTGFHARSNSFPSRPNPVISLLDDHLCRLRASEDASTSSSFGGKLSSLQDLHDCINKVLLLQLVQQAMAQENNEKWVDEPLDGSLQALDLCNSAKDALTVVKKAICKALKVKQNKCTFSSSNGDHETTTMFNMLKELRATSLNLFESLLSFISGPKTKSAGWSLFPSWCTEHLQKKKLNLIITIVSYKGELRVGEEAAFVDVEKLKSCIESAIEVILKAACEVPEEN
ncbi:unnamed protein product [Dovyalis caffra]|uniref:Uncharacterized protein n=1 Tax=Dovyalis caffra TaxID=77055 RepID=A0AAV1R6G1_9ROSI|nr:unnamed protein product [Dovyalis caffra]